MTRRLEGIENLVLAGYPTLVWAGQRLVVREKGGLIPGEATSFTLKPLSDIPDPKTPWKLLSDTEIIKICNKHFTGFPRGVVAGRSSGLYEMLRRRRLLDMVALQPSARRERKAG